VPSLPEITEEEELEVVEEEIKTIQTLFPGAFQANHITEDVRHIRNLILGAFGNFQTTWTKPAYAISKPLPLMQRASVE